MKDPPVSPRKLSSSVAHINNPGSEDDREHPFKPMVCWRSRRGPTQKHTSTIVEGMLRVRARRKGTHSPSDCFGGKIFREALIDGMLCCIVVVPYQANGMVPRKLNSCTARSKCYGALVLYPGSTVSTNHSF